MGHVHCFVFVSFCHEFIRQCLFSFVVNYIKENLQNDLLICSNLTDCICGTDNAI